jgi:quinol---cytochrome c reductase iron-sulfur subunit, bacillus type
MCDHTQFMENQETTRRSFYSAMTAALGTLIGAALAIPAGAYLLLKPKSERKAKWVDAADVNSLQVGKPEEVVFHRQRVDGWRIVNEKATAWVVRTDPQTVIAYSPSCTHLGCAYHWDSATNNFICPCHTSAFSIDGKVLAGPAPRPLDRFETRVDNGKLLISPTIQSVKNA